MVLLKRRHFRDRSDSKITENEATRYCDCDFGRYH